MRNVLLFCLSVVCLLLTGCEKSIVGEQSEESALEGNVLLRLSIYEQESFGTRAVQDIGQWCSRVNVAFFQDGTKVKSASQERSFSSFGTVPVSIAAGTYEVVVIAHNCDGSATITNEETVTFPSNLVTDTFYYYGTLTVSDQQASYDLELQRCVAMFRLKIADAIPDDAVKIRFYYTGGSSTFSPKKGVGCVNSRQTVMMPLSPSQKVYEVYTLPRADSEALKMTITCYNDDNDVQAEKELTDVPITTNKITSYTCTMFGGTAEPGSDDPGSGSETSSGLRLSLNGEWGGTISAN